MTAKEAAEFLDLIAERAQVLRERGVRGRVNLGEVSFELADDGPADAPAPRDADAPADALLDPATYGIPDRDGDGVPRRLARRARRPLVEPGT